MPDIELMGATYPDVPAVDLPKSGGGMSRFYDPSEILYASSPTSGGPATTTNAIHYGTVDSTSTATLFTATVEGITELYDGVTVMLHNGVVTSASGFTLNINGLGAKPCYNNMTNATRETTIFNSAYTMMFVYSTSLDSGNGGWWIYRGYDANTNTIGYQLRTNSTVMTVTDTARYYKLYFTSADGNHWVPASVNSTNNATSARAVNQRPIDPFGRIVFTSANTSYAAGANLAATTIWDQYAVTLGYSFNRTGAALELTAKKAVYVKCAPQADGSAIMDATEPIVQDLPSTDDGKIYIYLGVAYDATHIELFTNHPVYYYKDGAIRLWTNAVSNTTVEPSTTNPVMDGTAAIGSSDKYARADHVHPSDTAKANVAQSVNIDVTADASWNLTLSQASINDLGQNSLIHVARNDIMLLRLMSGDDVLWTASMHWDGKGGTTWASFVTGLVEFPYSLGYGWIRVFIDSEETWVASVYSQDNIPNAASIDNSGLITFKNGLTSLFTLQLPIYNGGVS